MLAGRKWDIVAEYYLSPFTAPPDEKITENIKMSFTKDINKKVLNKNIFENIFSLLLLNSANQNQ